MLLAQNPPRFRPGDTASGTINTFLLFCCARPERAGRDIKRWTFARPFPLIISTGAYPSSIRFITYWTGLSR